jgi:hypothetical protein
MSLHPWILLHIIRVPSCGGKTYLIQWMEDPVKETACYIINNKLTSQ